MPHKISAELNHFLEVAKSKGISDESLAALLIYKGWPKDEVFAALSGYWERTTGMALPERLSRGESSRDAFLYLLSFATLATWASALGRMLFHFVNHWFPDAVSAATAYNLRSAITWQMASIAVAFPIFVVVMRTILVEASAQPERLQSGVRRWLTYLALLLTAGGLIGDLICFLNFFLTGEITVRFVLKSLTVLIICGAIFVYYLGSLRWDSETGLAPAKRQSIRFGAGAAFAVIIAFITGLVVSGTPSAQRHLEADNRRVQDLRAIANVIYNRSASGKALPASLVELGSSEIKDPESGATYNYRPRTLTTYDLCATFAGSSERDQLSISQIWNHGKGQTCFTLDASRPPAW